MTKPKPRIFIVDDDQELCAYVAAVADSYGLQPQTYNSATQCLAALSNEALSKELPLPLCVITDFQMPGMDGAKLADLLVDLKIPVIMITGHLPGTPLAPSAQTLSAHSVLYKPFSEIDLLVAIAKAAAAPGRRSMGWDLPQLPQ